MSKSTFSVSWGSTSTAGRAAFLAAASAASSSSRALSMSSRGNRFSPLVTAAVSGRAPHSAAASQVRLSAGAPIWAKSFSQLSGMKGVSRMPQMRVASSRLYSTWASRLPLVSISFARAQGAFSSIYLLARWMALKISSRALWGAKVSMSSS